jgi:hypothetical protein
VTYTLGTKGDEEKMENTFNKNSYENKAQENNPYNEDSSGEKTVNAESLNIDTTLNEISGELKPGETLILDIGNNYFHQTDEIYDTLVMRGYDVRKSFKNGRNQIIVSKKAF